jgi:hypothetical protein
MISPLLVPTLVLFFGLPSLFVLCACIAGARADQDYRAE